MRGVVLSLLGALLLAQATPGLAAVSGESTGKESLSGSTTGEEVVAGLSQNEIAITANFDGSEILIYGAVKREAPIPKQSPLQVIITLQGPAHRLVIQKKTHEFGMWLNTQRIRLDSAPSFYAIATSGPIEKVLSYTDDLRYRITIPRAIRDVGTAGMAPDVPAFIKALIRVRQREGLYVMDEDTVKIEKSTLFSSRVKLPSNLSEGTYRVRIFLTREGKVVNQYDSDIIVQKTGLERWLYHLAQNQSAIYGFLSLAIAVAAGWLASAAFRLAKR